MKRAAARLNLFYDYVLIDEFQDFREHDYELIMALTKQLKVVMLVGDYHRSLLQIIQGSRLRKRTVMLDIQNLFLNCKVRDLMWTQQHWTNQDAVLQRFVIM